MKTSSVCCILCLFILPSALAQSRFSLAPTYWFNRNNYTYQVHLLSDPSMSVVDFSGYGNGSSIGLTACYSFGEKWSFSVGTLYNKSVSHVNTSQTGDVRLETKYIQLPALINYRLTIHRLSPYFSAGISVEKNASAAQDKVKASALLGVGLDYRLSPKLSLLVQPTGSYLLYKPADDALIRYITFNSYKIGVQAQAIWHF